MLSPKEIAKEVYCARYQHHTKGLIWFLFDKEHKLEGYMKESRNKLIRRWQDKYGKFGILTRFQGICRLSELVVCISSVRNP